MTHTGLYILSKIECTQLLPCYCIVLCLNSEKVHYIISGENAINQDTGRDSNTDKNENGLPEPLWLLILEVIAAVSFLCLLTLCTITGLRRCRARSSGSGNSSPWTRAVSWKENTVISIGWCRFFIRVSDKSKLYNLLVISCYLCR
jgi:hypothetical protein